MADTTRTTEMDLERDDSMVRHEEELVLGTEEQRVGGVLINKRVESEDVEELHHRDVEHVAGYETVAVGEVDSGEIETLPDGSISVPVFEERLVVKKELVVRERVIVRKNVTTHKHPVRAELRKEQVEVDYEGQVDGGPGAR